MVFFMPLKSHTQELLTYGEIYDYEPGDLFHYNAVYLSFTGDYFYKITNIEILDKYLSTDFDTVYYVRNFIHKDSSNEVPYWTYFFSYDTIAYTNLNGNPYEIDSVYSDPSMYNGRTINRNYYYFELDTWTYLWVRGCGLAYHYSWSPWAANMSEYELVYYYKNGEEWGVPLLITGINENNERLSNINIFPNPATSFISITYKRRAAHRRSHHLQPPRAKGAGGQAGKQYGGCFKAEAGDLLYRSGNEGLEGEDEVD